MPHISVADLRWINWDALSAAGFKACVFDKDNTLCKPFAVEVDESLRGSVEAARAAFGGKLAIYSNSAGLAQYDPQGVLRVFCSISGCQLCVRRAAVRALSTVCIHGLQSSLAAPIRPLHAHFWLQLLYTTGEEAEALEAQFGIHCLRHTDKKPAGGCSELEAHFG